MRAENFIEGAAFGLRFEHAVGEREDLRRRAIVRLDAMDGGAGVAIRKREDVFDVGAAPRVDALRVVADGHHLMMRADEIDDLGLKRVGVLIFVDEDVAEAVGEIFARGLRLFQEFEPVFEEVVVIDDVGGFLGLGVFFREERGAFDDRFVLRKETRDDLVEGKLGVARHRE
jgi:hypothetical protein